MEGLYTVYIIGERKASRLSALMKACGDKSILATQERSYIVKSSLPILEKLKSEVDWIDEIEEYDLFLVATCGE